MATRAAVCASVLPPIAPDGRVALVPSLASMCERVLCAAGVTLSSLGAALATCESLHHSPGLGAYCGQVVTLNADIVLALAAAAWQPGAPPGGAAQWDALLSASDGLVHGRYFSRGTLALLRASAGAAHLSMVRTFKSMKRAEYYAVRPSSTWRGVTAASQQSRWRAAWGGGGGAGAAQAAGADSAPTSAAGYGLSQGVFDCVNRDAAWVRATLFPDESDPAQALWTDEELLLQQQREAAAHRRRRGGAQQAPATPHHHHPRRADNPQLASLARPASPQQAAPPPGSPHEPLGRALPSPTAASHAGVAEVAARTGGHPRASPSSSALRARSTSASSIIDPAQALRLQPVSFREAWDAINAVGGGGAGQQPSHEEDERPVSSSRETDDGEVATWVRAVLPHGGAAAAPSALRSSVERLCCNLLELGLGPAAATVSRSLSLTVSAADFLAICDASSAAVRALLAHTADRHFGDVGVSVCRDLLSATMADDAAALLKRLKASRKRLLDMTRDALAAAAGGGGRVDALSTDQRGRIGRRGEVLGELWSLGRLVPLVDALATHVTEAVAVAGPAGGDEEAYLAGLLALAASAQAARESLVALLDGGLSPAAVGPLSRHEGLDDVLRGAVVGAALAQAQAAPTAAAASSPAQFAAVAAPFPTPAPTTARPAASSTQVSQSHVVAAAAARPAASSAAPLVRTAATANAAIATAALRGPGSSVATPAFPSLAQAHASPGGGAPGVSQRRHTAGVTLSTDRPLSSTVPVGTARGVDVQQRQPAVVGGVVSASRNIGIATQLQQRAAPTPRSGATPLPAAVASSSSHPAAASPLPTPPPFQGPPASRSLREVIASEEAAAATVAAAAKARAAAAQQAAAATAAAARAAADREAQQARRFLAAASSSSPPVAAAAATGASSLGPGGGGAAVGGGGGGARRSLADIMLREQEQSSALAARAASRAGAGPGGGGGSFAAGAGAPRSPAGPVQHTPWGAPALAASMQQQQQQQAGALSGGGGGSGVGGAQSLAEILSSEEAMRLGREAQQEAAAAAAVAAAAARRHGSVRPNGGSAPRQQQPQQPQPAAAGARRGVPVQPVTR